MIHNLISRILTIVMMVMTFSVNAQEENPYSAMPVTDADGNIYQTIMVEAGVWIAENLKTTRYNDGTEIPLNKDNKLWGEIKSPAYGWYLEDPEYKDTYGAIYNWHAVATGKLCPVGWHVPTEKEWDDLMDYAGGIERLADNPAKLKEAGFAHWKSPNDGATNEIFFTALPAGEVSYFNTDAEPGTMTNWWTSTEGNPDPDLNGGSANGLIIGLKYNFHSKTGGTYQKESALPVRCVMDFDY